MSTRKVLFALAAIGIAMVVVLSMRAPGASKPTLRAVTIVAPFQVQSGTLVVARLEFDPPEAADAATVRWLANAGRVVSQGDGSVTWVAPAMPGRCKLAVVAMAGETRVETETTFEVLLPAPRHGQSKQAILQIAAEQRATRDQEIEARITRLLPVAQGDRVTTDAEIEGRFLAMTELGDLYLKAGRYEDAAALFDRQRSMVMPGRRDYKQVMEKRGIAAFFLGEDQVAIDSIQKGEDYANGMSRYYLARLLEERGDFVGAVANYAWSSRQHDNLDATFRQAWLELEKLRDAKRAAETLARASIFYDRRYLMERLTQDPEMRGLHDAWLRSGLTMQDTPGWTSGDDVAPTI